MAGAKKSRFTRRGVLSGGAVAVAAGAAYAFRPTSSIGFQRPKADAKTFNRGNISEPESLDPQLCSATYENNILGDMFMGLMTEDAAGNPVFGAAESYKASDDGLTYTFRIRDHKWSDGTPVTAHDFVFSFRRVLDPKTAAQYASIVYPIKNGQAVNGGKMPVERLGVRAIGERTLEIAFEYEVPYLPQLLMHYAWFGVPRHVIERHGDQWTRPENIVTNGPYALKEWIPNDHILLTGNPHFYDTASVSVESVYFYPLQDFAAALKRLRAGELDINTAIPTQEINWLKRTMPGIVRLTPWQLTEYVMFNVTQTPFNDVRVRQALSLAVDREILTSKVLHGGEKPAYAFVPPHMPDYPGTAALRLHELPMTARIAKAQDLLREAGFTPARPLEFVFNFESQSDNNLVAVVLQAMWARLGVRARLMGTEGVIHYESLRKHDFTVALGGWSADYRDAKDFLFTCQVTSPDLNNGLYNNPKFDALINRSDRTRDPVARGQLLSQAEQILLDDVGVAPLYYGVSRNLVSQQVRGWVNNEMGINRTRYISLDRGVASV